jgi:hypothetical protein
MTFVNDIAFWGILGLMVPVIIHLLSKKKKNTVLFGSLKFLQPSESQSVKSLRLTQKALLLLRMSMLAFVVFMIGKPVISSKSKSKTAYIDFELIDNPDFISLNDDFINNSDHQYYSASNDIKVKDVLNITSLWSLIHKANQHSDSVTVYSMNKLNEFQGSAIPLNNNVKWVSFPTRNPVVYKDTITKNGTSIPLEIKASDNHLKIKKGIPVDDMKEDDIISIKVIGSIAASVETQSIIRLIEGIKDELPLKVIVSNEDDADWMIAVDTTPHTVDYQNIIAYNPYSEDLNLKAIRENYFLLDGVINSENLIDSQFADQLTSLLLIKHTELENKYDILLPENIIPRTELSVLNANLNNTGNPQDYKFLWLIAILMCGIERYFSTFKISDN